jgi:hypothetical protein
MLPVRVAEHDDLGSIDLSGRRFWAEHLGGGLRASALAEAPERTGKSELDRQQQDHALHSWRVRIGRRADRAGLYVGATRRPLT